MKKEKKIKSTEELFGVKITHCKELDKLSGKVLFPEKLKIANDMISKMKNKPF